MEKEKPSRNILKLYNPNQKPIINKITNRILMLSPTVRAGLERECTMDDFETIKEIGRGGYGSVLQVIHKTTNKVWCIKCVPKEEIISQNLLFQINREIEIMYKINHPHCLKLKNHFEDEENFYLIMPLCSRGQLYSELRKVNKFSERQAAQILREVISGLKYLHSFTPPIIHRDIKPENLLLNDDFRVFLADFGWSNYMKGGMRKTFCGTPEYLAPEMLKQEPHDHKVDIWSLGVLLYELLTGYSPFAAKNNYDLYQNILNLRILWPNDMSSNAKNLITKILKINPADRISLDEIINHKFFKQTIPIHPLLENDLKTTKDLLVFHMMGNVSKDIDNKIDNLILCQCSDKNSIHKSSIDNEGSGNDQFVIKKTVTMKSGLNRANFKRDFNSNIQLGINVQQEQIDVLKFENSKLLNELNFYKKKLEFVENEYNKNTSSNTNINQNNCNSFPPSPNNNINSTTCSQSPGNNNSTPIKDPKLSIDINAENKSNNIKDKETIDNLESMLKERNNTIEELNKKIKILQKDNDSLYKEKDKLKNEINSHKTQISNNLLKIDELSEKNYKLIIEKAQVTEEAQKKIQSLQFKLNDPNYYTQKTMINLLQYVNESLIEIKKLFDKKITSFITDFNKFKNEFVNRDKSFNNILNSKSLELLNEFKKINNDYLSTVNNIINYYKTPNENVQNNKIEWQSKQINELQGFKNKSYEYELKNIGLTNILEVLRENYSTAQYEIQMLKRKIADLTRDLERAKEKEKKKEKEINK